MAAREIVIIGGGIIGCTTAYYLSRHPSFTSSQNTKITLIEASKHGPAQGASGKQAACGSSFDEHVKLAEEHNGKDRWGWRYVGCGSWEGQGSGEDTRLPGGQKPLQSHRTKRRTGGAHRFYTPMAKHGSTAQVHPYLFTTSMFQMAKDNGVAYITARSPRSCSETALSQDRIPQPRNQHEREDIRNTSVLAAGAWSPRIIPSLPVSATRAHSITIRPRGASPSRRTCSSPKSATRSCRPQGLPEIYARPDNEVYACGTGDDEPLPPTVDEVVVDSRRVASISQQLREGRVEKRQACYLPLVSTGGGPIVGEAKQIAKGLYIGTGHTCWGISNAPGTAKALTELIMEGKIKSANLKKLDPLMVLF
ncbi:FAD dependent oxidoreductase [Pholiota molesta]|nr:FAD dependent oxidoreductase [Pholiota molesta]